MACQPHCQPCLIEDLSLPAVTWCIECEEALCTECDKSHRKNKASRQHVLVDILSKNDLIKFSVQNCNNHETDQKLDHFCIEHDQLCCRLCLTEIHRACAKVVSLHVAAADVKSSAMLVHVLEQAELAQTRLSENLKQLENESGKVQKQEKQLNDDIEAYKHYVIDWLNESAAILKAEINEKFGLQRQNIAELQQLLTKNKEQMESHLNVLKKFINSDANEQTFLLAQHLRMLIDDNLKETEKKTSQIEGSTWRFVANKSIECSENLLGKIETTFQETKEFEICLPSLAVQSCSETLYSKTTKPKLGFRSEFQLVSDTNALVRGIAVTEDDNILVCNHSKLEVQRYLPNGEYVDSCDVQRYPWNIAIFGHGSSKAVVSLTGNLALASMFTLSGHLRIINIKEMANIKELKLKFVPLAVTTIQNEIVVGTWNKIQVLKQDGTLIRELNIQSNKCAVTYLHLDSTNSDTIYYSSSDLYQIHRDGNNCQKIDCVSGRPRGICSDKQGFLYTATSDGKLYKLYPDGTLCDILLDGTEGYDRLWAAAFNLDYTKLYVSTRNGKSLNVFQIR